jgi:heme a synthase
MRNMDAMVKEHYRQNVARWLLICMLLVVCMVVLGGYTRLSGSGLSITDWKPIHGVIPPLSAGEWQEEFDQYRATPQFEQINPGMTVETFKAIFWPEYLHRLLGRLVGAVFFFPLLYFAARRAFSLRTGLKLTGIFALGGLQGFMGWYMVKSGLVNDPYVSHHRLSLHLSLALLIFALLLWQWLNLKSPWRHVEPSQLPRSLRTGFTLIFALLCVQIIYGAFMAGLHAGLIYNTFPMMNERWVPDDFWPDAQPAWFILTENISTVQFVHRWLAKLLGFALIFWWFRARRHAIYPPLARVFDAVLTVCLIQIMLGVATLVYQVPWPMALAHQFMGLLLFALCVAALHGMRARVDKINN